jgi:AcrR family transcriptional regulator
MVGGHQRRQTHVEREETRQIILRVAQQLFMQYGYRAVTTRQLADACGLTQPALYHYFSDKQELYLAVVTEDIAKIKAAIERITRRSEGVPERLKLVASFLLGRIQYDLSLMLHDVRYELSPDARALLDKQFHSGFILPLTALFEQGVREGLLCSVEAGGLAPLPTAYLFMSMLSAFAKAPQGDASARGRRTAHAASADMLVRILFHGLSGSDGA